MIRTLQYRGVHQGIDVFMECTIRSLFKDGDHVAGGFGYWRESGRFVVFRAPAVVLATGGIGRCWEINSNSWEYTADGHAMALWAGADLIDMEFVQFHPTGMVWPPSVRGTLITEGVRGEGGVLLNGERQRFMFRYIPDRYKGEFAETEDEATKWVQAVIDGKRPDARRPPELLTRDVVARAIRAEVLAGRGTPHGGVYLDIASRRTPEVIKRKLPGMYHQFKELADVDITKEPMEVGPTCHYMMGGVRADSETGQSTVPGLFAAGEAAAGLHGANRLGGNSLSDLLVFGRRAGLAAAQHAKRSLPPSIDNAQIEQAEKKLLAPFSNSGTESPYAVHRDLQEVMQNLVGIFRTDEDLKKALAELVKLKSRAARVSVEGSRLFNPGWHLSFDLKSMLTGSEAVTYSALARTESRGAHSRIDHPSVDSAWEKKHNIIVRESGGMSRREVPIEPMPKELQEILDEDKA